MKESPDNAQAAASSLDAFRGSIERLPVTMRPSLNQQMSQWTTLFPFEQNRVAQFIKGVETFSPAALDGLTAPLWALEKKMGVKQWNFSEASDTIENASQLARSAYYAEWRREVQRVFEAINTASRESAPIQNSYPRLILLFLPRSLPVDPLFAWKRWDPRGREIKISGGSERLCELVLQGHAGLSSIATLASHQGSRESSDLWLIDAEAKLSGMLSPLSRMNACSLSFAALKPFRDRFLAELNKASKDIQATDEIIANLRHESWDAWGLWPGEVSSQPRLRRFVIDLFLSGNGAVIFSNAFVEWAASEALRRARPRTIVARFGMRSKPKPFTSIAVFENQQRISSLPDVDDPENSAIDAMILARYVWLSAGRYTEQEQTLCLCVAEHGDSAYVIPPAGKSLGWSPERPIAPEELDHWIEAQFIS
ncbi:MAG TPA: hypothetical protein VMQ56_17430 [Terracidiphilus sp.]|nr:hypothetical protein [Terracidiphilus sp.]